MRLLLIGLVLLVAGCDSADESVAPVFSSLIVTVEPNGSTVTVETEDSYGTGVALDILRERTAAGMRLVVRGVVPDSQPNTESVGYGRATLPLDLEPGTYALELSHLGQTDVYELVRASRATSLRPVRTEVSRLGPR